MKKYDLCFIGAGPSTVMALLTLTDKGYKGNVAVIEKGKRIEDRGKDIINGFGGAGTFSDGKLSSSLNVGGNIPGLKQEELEEFEKYILKRQFYKFNEAQELKWDETGTIDTSGTNLTFDKHKTCHLGTEVTRKIYLNMEKYLMSFSNIDFFWESEATSVFKLAGNEYEIIFKGGEIPYVLADKVVLATGQKNILPATVIKELELNSIPRAFQLGVRVEDTMNPQYVNIIKANYDFKFVGNYSFDSGVNIRVRTFCCNSGNAHTCAEKNTEGFTCFNGHAYKAPDPENHSVNYGIICEIEGCEEFNSKENQIQLMEQVNALPTWKKDNFNSLGDVKASRRLLDGFEHLRGLYPDEVIEALNTFVADLSKLVDLSQAHYLYPEVKLSGSIPNLNYNTFETTQKGLYMIGDCVISRGIVKASYTGWKLANGLSAE